MRSKAFACLGTCEAEHLKGRGRFKDRAVHPQPVVERVLGPTDRALRTICKVFSGFKGRLLQIGIFNTE